jgi:hypothetical protein
MLFRFSVISVVVAISLLASIVNTRHNLSISNTVAPLDVNDTIIKASTETEICVFCHVPHSARPVGAPLWNRSMPTTDYVMYESDYLRRMEYPIATSLGVDNDTPGALSRQCLSCHDGTIAVGAVHKLRYNVLTTPIDMVGVDGSGMIPDTAAGFIGTNLTKHHPVGIVFDDTKSYTFNDGSTRDMELVYDATSAIKLFEYPSEPGKKYVECSSCHDPHKEGSNTKLESNKFLRVDSEGSLGKNFYKTCISCHSKKEWSSGGPNGGPSVHHSPPNDPSYADLDGAVNKEYGTTKISDLGCANCHVPHNGGSAAYLNRQAMAVTCFQGAASSEANAKCHGNPGITNVLTGSKEVKKAIEKLYTHPVYEVSGDSNHTNLDVLYGYNTSGTEMVDSGGVGGMSWGTNKHAMCMDCHNPHRARAGTHIETTYPGYPTTTYPYGITRTVTQANDANKVSPALYGVTGVEPTWPSTWTQPTAFTTKESAEKEYQICFKCHSYYGLGSATNATTIYVSPSGAKITDVAWEMNKNNKSGHPVVFPNTDSGSIGVLSTGRPGSYYPQKLDVSQLTVPWSVNPGENTMYCSDCHGNDDELLGDPKGPHGSDLLYLLKGVNRFWPARSTGVLWTMDDILASGDSVGLFCKNCHIPGTPHTEWSMNMSGKGYQCVECHVTVPHGSPVSRLMGYSGWPAPYNYLGNSLKMFGWVKRPYDVNDQGDNKAAYATHTGGANCHQSDNSATWASWPDGGYDANLMAPLP